jgi:signal peptidase
MTALTTRSIAPVGLRRRAADLFLSEPGDGTLRRWAFRSVLAVFVLLILASYAVPLWFQIQGDRLLVVTSGSMAPEIQAGDAVVIRQVTSASQLRPGQVVTFYPTESSQLITHRIVYLATVVRRDENGQVVVDQNGNELRDPYIRTKGDANATEDPNLTPATQVRGIVREVHPGWGFLLGLAHSPLGRLLLFAPPLLMLAGAELISRVPAGARARRRLWGPDADVPVAFTAAEAAATEERDDAPALV